LSEVRPPYFPPHTKINSNNINKKIKAIKHLKEAGKQWLMPVILHT
jgi:hypothetical protein